MTPLLIAFAGVQLALLAWGAASCYASWVCSRGVLHLLHATHAQNVAIIRSLDRLATEMGGDWRDDRRLTEWDWRRPS